jgi:tetratricopeptide (TPR) repeat protein
LKSSKVFDARLRQQPRSHESHYGLGINLFFMNDFDGALRKFTDALKLQPEDAGYQTWLGLAYLYKGMLHNHMMINNPDHSSSNGDYSALIQTKEQSFAEAAKYLSSKNPNFLTVI